MKRFSIAITLALFALITTAQTKAKPKTPVAVKKSVVVNNSATTLKSFSDSASYALGLNISQSIKRDLKTLNSTAFLNAMKTVFNGQAPMFTEDQVRSILMRFSQQEEVNHAKPAIEAGEAFLSKNKNKPGVQTTASGLQYEVLKEGTGAKPTAMDTIVCNYRGTLLDGTEFDNSYERGEPLTIRLSDLVPGWIEGVQLMGIGSKYRFYIPYQLGYGLRSAGTIPPGSAIIFDIELLDIKKTK